MTCRLFGFAKHSGWEGIRKVPMRSDHINFTPLQYRFCHHIFFWKFYHLFLRCGIPDMLFFENLELYIFVFF